MDLRLHDFRINVGFSIGLERRDGFVVGYKNADQFVSFLKFTRIISQNHPSKIPSKI
jgi:hypothetical protein